MNKQATPTLVLDYDTPALVMSWHHLQ